MNGCIVSFLNFEVLVLQYHWADGNQVKKPIKCSAPKYIDFLMTWVQVSEAFYLSFLIFSSPILFFPRQKKTRDDAEFYRIRIRADFLNLGHLWYV